MKAKIDRELLSRKLNSKWDGNGNWAVTFQWGELGCLGGIDSTSSFDTKEEAKNHIKELRTEKTVLPDEEIQLKYVGKSDTRGFRPIKEIY